MQRYDETRYEQGLVIPKLNVGIRYTLLTREYQQAVSRLLAQVYEEIAELNISNLLIVKGYLQNADFERFRLECVRIQPLVPERYRAILATELQKAIDYHNSLQVLQPLLTQVYAGISNAERELLDDLVLARTRNVRFKDAVAAGLLAPIPAPVLEATQHHLAMLVQQRTVANAPVLKPVQPAPKTAPKPAPIKSKIRKKRDNEREKEERDRLAERMALNMHTFRHFVLHKEGAKAELVVPRKSPRNFHQS